MMAAKTQSEPRFETTRELVHEIDVEKTLNRLSGRGDGLRKSKPTTDRDNGFIQYCWRMARFHAGYDTSMPVTASWWLQDYLDARGIEASVTGITDDPGSEITSLIDESIVPLMLEELGESHDKAAERWQGVVF